MLHAHDFPSLSPQFGTLLTHFFSSHGYAGNSSVVLASNIERLRVSELDRPRLANQGLYGDRSRTGGQCPSRYRLGESI